MEGESLKRGVSSTVSFTFLGKLLGFLSVILIARYFGATLSTDIYYLCLSFVTLFVALLLVQQTTLFTPLFIELRTEQSETAAWGFANSVFTITVFTALLFSVTLILAPLGIMTFISNYSEEEIKSSLVVVRHFSLILFLMALVEFLKTLLQALGLYTIPSLTVFINNCFLILFLILFHRRIAVESISYALIFSFLAQLLIMLFFLRRKAPLFKIQFTNSVALQRFWSLSWPVLFSQIFSSTSMYFYDFTASFFDSGTLTSISYAQKLAALPEAVFIAPIAPILAVKFGELYSVSGKVTLLNAFYKFNNFLWFILIPLSFFIIIFSYEIVDLAYNRGNFSEHAFVVTRNCLSAFALSIFGLSFVALYSRLVLTIQRTRLLSFSAVLTASLSIALTYFAAHSFGYIGIPMVRTFSILIVSVSIGVYFCYRYFENFEIKKLLLPFLKFSLFSLISLVVVKGTVSLLPFAGLTLENKNLHSTLILVFSATLFAAIYLFLNLLFGSHEVSEVVTLGKNLIARFRTKSD